jgi:hypothetical protein
MQFGEDGRGSRVIPSGTLQEKGVPSTGVPGSLSSRQAEAGDDVLSNANLTVT